MDGISLDQLFIFLRVRILCIGIILASILDDWGASKDVILI